MADERERFERLYREHFRAVLRFAAVRIDPERAKDVAAETFLVAWRRLEDVPDEPRAWLLGVARKVIAGQFRSQSRRDALAARLRATDVEDTPADPASALADRDEVLAAFAALGERDREVLRLIAWDGLSNAEASDVLAITRLAFAVRLHRARRRLVGALEPESPSPAPPKRRRHADARS
ncbi:MAG TPA: sigma-70 family RNA polymerase sigma factor [Gaiellaceae bacterium]|nr:sigma-70 family RNA polymerase sigma factor [Gaiellaceae bacterium]